MLNVYYESHYIKGEKMPHMKFKHDPMITSDDENDRLFLDDSAGCRPAPASERPVNFRHFHHSKGPTYLNINGSSRIILLVIVLVAIFIPAYLMVTSSSKGKKPVHDVPQPSITTEEIAAVEPEHLRGAGDVAVGFFQLLQYVVAFGVFAHLL